MNWYEKSRVGLLKVIQHFETYSIRVYEDRIAIQSPTQDPISWETLQRIKNQVIGEVFAIEVFPAIESEVVNLRNTRHLWFGPEVDKLKDILKHPEFSKE